MRAASTAACTVCCGTLREYSIWWAVTASSARIKEGTPVGRSRSDSTAGASRRYQRSVPRAMARSAARPASASACIRAASADRPSLTTASTTRAAPARAAAPGAQRDLAKSSSGEVQVVGEFRHREHAAPRFLHLPKPQDPLAALNQEKSVPQPDYRAWFGGDRSSSATFVAQFTGEDLGGMDPKALHAELSLR